MAATIDDLLNEMRLGRQSQEVGNDEARQQAERERKLLGQSEKQYEETLEQRKVAQKAADEMAEIQETLGADAENNKQYQQKQIKFNKEQAKLQKLEGRRNLLQRFKDTKEEKGTGAAARELGGTALAGMGKAFKGFLGFIKRFAGIFAALILPALVLFVNSPYFQIAKEKIKQFIDYLSPDNPDGPFGPNGFLRMMIDKFGGLNIAIAGVLGVLTLKALGFGGLKLAFAGLKSVVIAISGAFMTALTALSGFFGIAVAPFVAIIAAIAAVGYALYDTFVEVKKKFDEGASVGELIRTAVVNFYGAFGKILDFVKDLTADVLGFFGVSDETVAKIKGFSFEKIIEDFLTKAIEGIKSLFDFDFKGFIAKLLPGPDTLIGKGLAAVGVYEAVGIDSKTGEPLEDPATKAAREAREKKIEEAQDAKDKEIRKIERQLNQDQLEERAIQNRVGRFQRDVDDDRSGAMFFAESKEEQAEDLKKLQDEKKKLAEFRERQQALEAQLSAAKSAPIVIDGKTINVNEGGKTENNVSHPPAMVPNGTTGQLARGGGYMGVDYF